MDSVEAGWYNSCTQTYDPSTRCALMRVAPARDWNVFQQIFAEHWDGFKHAHPRYQTSSYEGLVAKMLRCGDPDQMGYVEYRCLQCGQGTHRVAMSCKSSLCLRCAKVHVDTWVSQVSTMLHEGVIYRHIILTIQWDTGEERQWHWSPWNVWTI